jgi:glycosyltransferase involved in cell wall biosynthesis
MPKVVIVLPAFNAEKTLLKTINEIPVEYRKYIILVDDASSDQTVDLALHEGLLVFQHSTNRGYGANQKTCYREALKLNADIVVMVHPDHQYDATVIPAMLSQLNWEGQTLYLDLGCWVDILWKVACLAGSTLLIFF